MFGQVHGSGVSGSIYLPHAPVPGAKRPLQPRPGRGPVPSAQGPAAPGRPDDDRRRRVRPAGRGPGVGLPPGTANPYPAWASQSNTKWGLSSYSANWQVFGDQGARLSKMQDGLSNTICSTRSTRSLSGRSAIRCSARRCGVTASIRGRSRTTSRPRAGGRPVPRRCAVGERAQPGLAVRERLLAADRVREQRRAGHRPRGPERPRGCAGACSARSSHRRSTTPIA